MPIEIKLPEVVSGFESGVIASWCVNEGDNIKEGDVIFEVETDKAVIEVETPGAGILGKILVDSNSSPVAVDTIVGLILLENEDPSVLSNEPVITNNDANTPVSVSDVKPDKIQAVPSASSGASRIIASPLAKVIAANNNINLSNVVGTGPRNRILKADVENVIDNKSEASPAIITTSAENKPDNSVPLDEVASTVNAENSDITPHTAMRKVIASRLTESKTTIPHFYVSIDCEVDNLNLLRAEFNAFYKDHDNVKLTVNDFVIKAVALAINKHPEINSMWLNEGVKKNKDIDISVAVSTEDGLMTPIVFNADRQGLITLSENMKSLVSKTRSGKLQPNEYQGGGFTISNLGMYDIDSFNAIINPPQSCILAVGRAKKIPVVKDDQIVIANVMNCTLSVDHRVIDGSVAAEFLQTFKFYIENPKHMMLFGGE
jgi:pyruvate dehydrogenase E2 component (dihydrolipoamide acetyltransferase)